MNKIHELLDKFPELGKHEIMDFSNMALEIDTILAQTDISLELLFALRKRIEVLNELAL
jgi:hypothetical protein